MIEKINLKRIKEGLVSRKDALQYCLERQLELKAIIAKYHVYESHEDCQKEIKQWWVSEAAYESDWGSVDENICKDSIWALQYLIISLFKEMLNYDFEPSNVTMCSLNTLKGYLKTNLRLIDRVQSKEKVNKDDARRD